jgi:hypothetical protein
MKRISSIHIISGSIAIAAFLSTGLFMKLNFPEVYASNESIRFLYRANHVYILFSGLLNLAIGLNFMPAEIKWKKALQFAGSILLLTGIPVFIWAFFTEPALGTAVRPITARGVFLMVIGTVLHVIGRKSKKA